MLPDHFNENSAFVNVDSMPCRYTRALFVMSLILSPFNLITTLVFPSKRGATDSTDYLN